MSHDYKDVLHIDVFLGLTINKNPYGDHDNKGLEEDINIRCDKTMKY
jgi:hypothetical protein